MLPIEQKFHEALSEEVVLFTKDCSPYYVSPSISKALRDDAANNLFLEEVTGIVNMISTLNLSLSYIMPLQSVPLGSSIKCNVSKLGHGYKAILIKDDFEKNNQ